MIKEINVSKNKYYDGHERVFYFEEKNVGLRGYIALHNTKNGPATGGTRLYPYRSKKEALEDVLKLSKAMTYKCIFSGVKFGGGKAVIIASPRDKNEDVLRAYANFIKSFKGKYTTGTDVGISDADTAFMSKITKFILRGDGGGTTTSLMAGRGVYESVITSFKKLIPNKKLSDMTIAIKGVGKIGAELIRLLYKSGAKITVADKSLESISKVKKLFPKVKVVDYKDIHKLKVDIYSPCAMGGEFNKKRIKELNCRIIVGGANNQFLDERDIQRVSKMGIVYIPDYVVNAGGLIQIVDELSKGGYNSKRVKNSIKNIGKSVAWLITESQKTGMTPFDVAQKVVQAKIN